jgi:hypothetical protein
VSWVGVAVEYAFKQGKNELGWSDFRLAEYHQIEKWWVSQRIDTMPDRQGAALSTSPNDYFLMNAQRVSPNP